jgi:hypothetical protein
MKGVLLLGAESESPEPPIREPREGCRYSLFLLTRKSSKQSKRTDVIVKDRNMDDLIAGKTIPVNVGDIHIPRGSSSTEPGLNNSEIFFKSAQFKCNHYRTTPSFYQERSKAHSWAHIFIASKKSDQALQGPLMRPYLDCIEEVGQESSVIVGIHSPSVERLATRHDVP